MELLRWLTLVVTASVVAVAVVGYLRFRDERRRDLAGTMLDHASSVGDVDANSQRAIAAYDKTLRRSQS